MHGAISDLYRRLIEGWNTNNAQAMAACMDADALVVGYDGSEMHGRAEAESQLAGIFANHRTATYVAKVRTVTQLGRDAAMLHAVVGMVPPGGSELMADRNAIQTVVARNDDGAWSIVLFQTTPAQFHGRSEASAALTAELSEILDARVE